MGPRFPERLHQNSSRQLTKVNYVKVPDFDPKDKTAIAPAELLAYLKALAKELEFMTFGEEKTR
jgi:hypothetical protein